MAKRDELGGLDEMAKREPEPQVLSVVLVTVTPTFSGDVAGYTTLTSADTTSATGGIILGAPASQPQTISSSDTNTSASAGFDFNTATSSSASTSSEARPTSTTSFHAQSTPATSFVAATTLLSSATFISQPSTNTAIAAASSTASSDSSSSSTQSGLSTGAKAGVAIVVLLVLAAFAVGALFLISKKKKQRKELEKADDEKAPFGAAAAARTAMSDNSQSHSNTLAPRLSLRPVSKLLPDLMGGGKKRASQGNPLSTFNQGPANTGTGRNLTPSPRAGSPWERPAEEKPTAASNPFSDPPNPFADSQRAAPPVAPPVSMTPPSTTNPAVAAGIAGTAAGVGLAAMAASARAESPKPLALSPKPASVASGRASPAGDAPVGSVYRIQMDFKPSMEDEIELRAGQLVRMIHEYDDGWALCTRLDRSQQGVAPRTCLAANPSKPRPTNGPPRGPGPNAPRPLQPSQNGPMRPPPNGRMSPAMGRPMSPANQSPRMPPQRTASPGPSLNSPRMAPGSRAASPGPGAYNLTPRPLSPGPRPAQKRSMSPGPYGPGGMQKPNMPATKRRSNSASNVRERRETPPGPSKLRSAEAPGLAM